MHTDLAYPTTENLVESWMQLRDAATVMVVAHCGCVDSGSQRVLVWGRGMSKQARIDKDDGGQDQEWFKLRTWTRPAKSVIFKLRLNFEPHSFRSKAILLVSPRL